MSKTTYEWYETIMSCKLLEVHMYRINSGLGFNRSTVPVHSHIPGNGVQAGDLGEIV